MAKLVILESPSKANTVQGYLGSSYKVVASKGHIRDLPKSTLGIDIENGFKPHYINIRGKGDVINDLKRAAKKASRVYIATDPDREGEAIAWHIADQLGIPKEAACRVTFNEITKDVVKEGIKNPRRINEDIVNSQQARRILDRLVGFNLSQVLWKSVKSGLSGGRVQSVATRIITDREVEIRNFVPEEYWTLEAELKTPAGESINARFVGDKKRKIKLSNEARATAIESALSGGEFRVLSVNKSKKVRTPQPPFTTSTLQQEASKKLGFQTQRIMKIAQELYDGLDLGSELGGLQGLITYMRTDSQRVSPVAQAAALSYISESFGPQYVPKKPRVYKSHTTAQDAHEAIRPSNVSITPKQIKKLVSSDHYKLYKLIWERFIASQMEGAVLDTIAVKIENSGYIFKTGGYTVEFRGYLLVYGDELEFEEESERNLSKLPELVEGELLVAESIKKQQHFTEPPMRYNEASLIKFLEENGIGRPSTYAPIISIILNRNYVKREGKSLVGTPLGELITKFMCEHFPEIVDYEFTASMESKLDSIENKENTIEGVISDFYDKFEKELREAEKSGKERVVVPYEQSSVVCESCGALMVYKEGRYGKFLACPSYPACRNTIALDKNGEPVRPKEERYVLADFKCELCGADVVVRNGKYGEFYACVNYPECRFTKQKIEKIGVACPKCGSDVVARQSRGRVSFYNCERYPECDFSSWDMPLPEKCPDCGAGLFYRKSRRSVICKAKNCSYKREGENNDK